MDNIIDAMKNIENDNDDSFMLPGFRFHPTDEELVGFYLKRKITHKPLSIELIKQLDIYKYDPWDLPKLATTGEKEWYFYCPRDRKYRNSARPNRVTVAGFWKATGTDRPIYSSECAARCIGLKKSLVFYRGRAAKGIKTDWMMHEFRLPGSVAGKKYLDKNIPANEAWAICRIFKKPNSGTQRALSHSWASTSPILHEMQSDIQTMNPFVSSNPPALVFPPCRPIYDHFTTLMPESYNIDASALLQDMSTSVFGEVFERGNEFNGFLTDNAVEEAKEKDDNEWGIRRPAMESSSYCNLFEVHWNKANPMWEYPSELSSAYPTNN